jgi:plasmid maintenance system killer protein
MRPIGVVRYSSHFRRRLKKLNRDLAAEVAEREKQFRIDCFHPSLDTHKLSGKLKGFWSFSITRKYRILFQFISAHEAYFIDVDDHDIYR